jgi:TolB protein
VNHVPACNGRRGKPIYNWSIMSRTAFILSLLVTFAGFGAMPVAQAQVRIDVSGVGATQLPISIASFATEGRVPQDIAAVVRANLTRSGTFRVLNPGRSVADTAPVDFASVRSAGAETFVAGSVSRLADGRFDIRYRLYDAVRQNLLAGESLVASEGDLRLAGHRISDAIFEKLTGEKGIFSTRIAFVTKQGNRFRLSIADWDGENVQSPLVSPEPIISPSWSPDGTRIAYVSFEAKKPVVYVHELASGTRTAVANFRGSNSAPAWSPDGRTLAVALTQDGLSQIYLINAADGGNARRITRTSGIDTEPWFAPDGKSIYFTSDRGGAPQIYRMPVAGGDATRITFTGPYNVSPRVSPDGRQLAYVTRRDGRYFVGIKDLASGNEALLTDGGREESPSFAPNGRWVMYTTQEGGRDLLMATSVDGRVKQRLTSSNTEIRESAWGPFAL